MDKQHERREGGERDPPESRPLVHEKNLPPAWPRRQSEHIGGGAGAEETDADRLGARDRSVSTGDRWRDQAPWGARFLRHGKGQLSEGCVAEDGAR